MIDGINITHSTAKNTHLLNLENWEILVNEKTMRPVNDNRNARFRGLDMQLKPKTNKDGFNFIVNGSLHKYFNRGLHNSDQFSFENLVQSIDSLSDVTGVSANEFDIHGLEVGLNIPLPFSPQKLLKNLVSYGNRPFDLMDKRSAKTGLQCALSQYKLKIYDKGRQAKAGGNILRFEVAFNKMQPLENYGIKTLSDLQDQSKVHQLVELLKEAARRIIWTDWEADLNQLTDRQQKQWLYYSNPKTWEKMTKQNRTYHAKKWVYLLKQYGNVFDLGSEITAVWASLFELENEEMQAPFLLPFYQLEDEKKALKIVTFLPQVYSVKRYEISNDFTPPFKIIFIGNMKGIKKPEKKRACLSCGKDISHQNKKSAFCSEKFVGRKQAKRCRNKDSNKRLAMKRKIERAKKKDLFLRFVYSDSGNTYSEILHPNELGISKHWFDKILSITPIPKSRNG